MKMRDSLIDEEMDLVIGKKLKSRRIEFGLTQDELAQKIGVTPQQVQKYERGINSVPLRRLLELADVFHTDIKTFWEKKKLNGKKMTVAKKNIDMLIKSYENIPDAKVQKSVLDLVIKISNKSVM